MNELELHNKIKNRLLAQTWSGGSNIVFPNATATTGSVKSVVDLENAFKASINSAGMRTPLALLATLSAQNDPEHGEEPNLVRYRIGVLVAVTIPGGAVGEEPMTGANIGDTTKSEGKGLAAIGVPFYSAVGKLNDLEGVQIQIRETALQGGKVMGVNYIAYRVWELEAWGTAS